MVALHMLFIYLQELEPGNFCGFLLPEYGHTDPGS